MQRVPVTPEGYGKLKDELERLLKVERPAIIKAIKEARAHGDLSENAEYHSAKEKQSFIEGRIHDLKNKVALAHVIDPSKIKQSRAAFGAKVRLVDLETDEERVYMLVGTEEADVKSGKISLTSPVGRAIVGKEAGDTVVVRVPSGTAEYEILEIAFE